MEQPQASPQLNKPGLSLLIELTATHEKMTSGIGADKAAFLIEEPRAADGTKVPPVFLLLFVRRRGSSHDLSVRTISG
jgi:hypothetical protein